VAYIIDPEHGPAKVVVRPSALKHGITADRIRHAVRACPTPLENPRFPGQMLYLAPDLHGNPLEVVGVLDDEGALVVFHAMPLRPAYRATYREINGLR
jgi:hypothetical protein